MPEEEEAPDTGEEGGPRPFWSGTLTFGLVGIPVALFPANRSAGVSLRMVSAEGTPLVRRYRAGSDGRALEADEIVRGYEVEPGRFVALEDEELERLAPERTRDIDLRVFVPVSEIDPLHFQRSYYLVPAGGSTKAYRLLARVMEETERAGIATFVMRAKEYLVAILAADGILRAETLRFADEVRTPEEIGLPEPGSPPAEGVERMERAVRALERDALDAEELDDPGAARLRATAERKARSGKDVFRAPAGEGGEADAGEVIDLMEVLKRRLGGDDGVAADGGEDALEARSKAELYARAQALDIPGRSGMNRAELIQAIRRSA